MLLVTLEDCMAIHLYFGQPGSYPPLSFLGLHHATSNAGMILKKVIA